jgi:hypothetical protein
MSEADVVFTGGRVVTMAGDDAEAVAVRDGRISHAGTAAGARERIGPGTEVVDLAGRMLMPGIHDAHLHPLSGGVVLSRPTLDYARLDKAAFLDAMRGLIAGDADRGADEWMAVDLWDATAMDEQPTRADLDALPTERPILVVALDGHIAVANSRALALAGVAAGTEDPPGGVIPRDAEGEPTGILLDTAIALLEAEMPSPTAESNATALRAAHEALVRAGVTSYMDASAFEPELAAAAALSDRGGLLVRTSAALTIQPEQAEDPEAMLDHLDDLVERFGRPDLTLRTAKLFLDGVIEHPTQTAAMLEPYLVEEDGRWVPGPSSGPTYFPQPVLNRAVAALDSAGWQVHVHAIGDRATRSALDAFEHARGRNGAGGLRHTIAHLEVVDPADHGRLRELRVLANLQLQWAQRDPYTVEHLAPYLGQERWEDLYPAAALRDAGVLLCGGSDWPVDALRPFAQLESAVTRTSAGRHGEEEPLFPAQAITLREALYMHTAASALQLHQEEVTGRIEAGLEADLIVLDRDLLEIPVGEIARTGVDLTMIAGRIVHRA